MHNYEVSYPTKSLPRFISYHISPKISQDNLTYIIPSELIKNIVTLEGLMTGRRTTQEASLPNF
jgi:hypothetical protein